MESQKSISSSKTPINPWFIVVVISLLVGSLSGGLTYAVLGGSKSSSTGLLSRVVNGNTVTVNYTDENSPVIEASSKSIDSVVSIVASRDVLNRAGGSSFFDQFFNDGTTTNPGTTTKQQVSAGTGFLVTADGYIITNRHVVDDITADYTVIFNNGTEVKGTVVDRDTVLDIAFVKVDPVNQTLKPLPLGGSANLKIGQTAIAIGNSLGEFSNTVSKGIVSGLNRSIQADDGSGNNVENLDNIIQTDASINSGNSGGPLLDITGSVIGVNVAKAQSGENIGFAIPIDVVKPVLDSVLKNGKIVRPYIGVRYVDVTPALAKARGLARDYGVLIEGSTSTNAVVKGSPADKAGIKAGDQILEINNEKITKDSPLRTILSKYSVGDKVSIKLYSGDKEKTVEVTLDVAKK
jgi:serine protease Do